MKGRSMGTSGRLTGPCKPGREPRNVCLLLAALLVAACGGCRKGAKGVNAADAACLEALAPYNPSHKLDESGRVVELRLDGKGVGDAALDQVKNLGELRVLSLYGSSVTDEGVAKLASLIHLEALGLGATQVTDRGLPPLERMPSLRWVWLTEDRGVTDRGVQKLQERALPGLTVYR